MPGIKWPLFRREQAFDQSDFPGDGNVVNLNFCEVTS